MTLVSETPRKESTPCVPTSCLAAFFLFYASVVLLRMRLEALKTNVDDAVLALEDEA